RSDPEARAHHRGPGGARPRRREGRGRRGAAPVSGSPRAWRAGQRAADVAPVGAQRRAEPRPGRIARRNSQGGDMSKVSEKLKAILAAIGAIEKQFGKGAVMRLGEGEIAQPV